MLDEAVDDLQMPTLDLVMDIDSLLRDPADPLGMDHDPILPPMDRLMPESYDRAVNRHLERQVQRSPLT